MSDTPRAVTRCSSCRLTQFVNELNRCRRCKRELVTATPERVEAPIVFPAITLRPQRTTRVDQPAKDESGIGLIVRWQITLRRRAINLTQKQLADRMAVPRTYVSKIERGHAIPTLPSLARFAGALRCDMRDLLTPMESR